MDRYEENIMFFVHDTFFYKDIIDSLPISLAVVDGEGKVYFVNQAWKDFFERFSGLSDSDFYNEDITILFEEVFMDENEKIESFISELKEAVDGEATKQDIFFDAVINGELQRFKVMVFAFQGKNKEREGKDKIITLEEAFSI